MVHVLALIYFVGRAMTSRGVRGEMSWHWLTYVTVQRKVMFNTRFCIQSLSPVRDWKNNLLFHTVSYCKVTSTHGWH